jgi:small subunit ribosomal protein S18
MPSSAPQSRHEKASKAGAPGQSRRRSCQFCQDKVEDVDANNVAALRHLLSDKGKIRSRRATGTCPRHQLQVAAAVKRAREMALLPYATR